MRAHEASAHMGSMGRLSTPPGTAVRAAIRDTAVGAAAVLSGIFIMNSVSDPVAGIIAVMPIALGVSHLAAARQLIGGAEPCSSVADSETSAVPPRADTAGIPVMRPAA
ncbi:hypothetical protein [Arthrobacter sp. IK3]|uniref:hypothetical protein n=1 Tax=Arthrobacter sp. IK3 TaxID=3448169 RepID=UPI003EE408B8